MVSQAKQIANQLNASHSTGPRTDAGKRAASRNRLRHGFFSADVVLDGEDPAAYAALLADLVDEHKPQTATQMACVQRIASCTWKLWRLERSAAHAHERCAVQVRHEAAQRDADAGDELRHSAQPRYHLFWHAHKPQLERTRAYYHGLTEHTPPAATLAASIAESTKGTAGAGAGGDFERLARYEQRLQNMIHRALNELRKLRQDRSDVDDLPDSPYARGCADQDNNGTPNERPTERNEPTDPRAAGSPSVTTSPNVPECATREEECRNEPTDPPRPTRRASSG